MRDECDHGGQQLGAGGLDVHRGPVGGMEGDAVEVTRVVTRLELGLGHRGLERDVPQPWRFCLVGLAAGQVAQEPHLRHGARAAVDGAVVDVPVKGEAEPPEQRLEGLLVLDGQHVAQLDEVAPADGLLIREPWCLAAALAGGASRASCALVALLRRDEALDIRLGGVPAHAVVVLHPTLRGQSVVVPADRVEHLEPGHPLVAGKAVRVGVGEHVSHMQRPARGWRGSVDGEDTLSRPGQRGTAVEGVGPLVGPYPHPLVLEAVDGRLVGHGHGALLGSGVGPVGHCQILPDGGSGGRIGFRLRPLDLGHRR